MNYSFDPFSPTRSVYECYDCGHRVAVDGHRGVCPECSGQVKNIAVARE
jgi:Zn finger protein HypA/HybF involved in hydrogenase expression